ncbi:hypothetical protein [Streptomyces sp. AC555_RSS877]|uniref:hypothetical protein n=1 Tax=Streptomyces sp. AC555_RSS877 TaxID=2823688 RepID=UPI0026652972|nr:hypothetical protein [Streptomyces sp. AC555_RSS877]
MTPEEIASVREDLEAFAAELFDGFFRADQRRWGQAYVRGLLLRAAQVGGTDGRSAE